jgi:hypothetical protein
MIRTRNGFPVRLKRAYDSVRRAAIILGPVFVMRWASPCFAQSAAPTPAVRNDYGHGDNWLCRPGRHDACVVDLTTTAVTADGTLTRETWSPNPDAKVDCFYVYPTVSTDTTPNSGMTPGPGERGAVETQLARFGSKCRLYAPMYRQITLAGLEAQLLGRPTAVDTALAYHDVLDAWNYYLAHDNQGRGVVLIGHSQGARWLTVLIMREIEGKPVQSRIVSRPSARIYLAGPERQGRGRVVPADAALPLGPPDCMRDHLCELPCYRSAAGPGTDSRR